MIKIEKHITITFDGEDVKTLSNICELARREIGKCVSKDQDGRCAGGYSGKETRVIEDVIDRLFSASS